MIDLYFYDREGKPVVGKAPTPLHVVGNGTLSEAARRAIDYEFRQFTEAHRLGLYDSLVKQIIRIDALTELRLSVNQGVFHAVANVEPSAEDQEFFGGILVPIERVLPEFFNDYWTNTAFDYVGSFSSAPRGNDALPKAEHRAAHPLCLHSKAPSVPGPLGEKSTTTSALIFQISRRGDLTRKPLASGLIKVFRIGNYNVGSIASHGYDGERRYVLSADSAYFAGDGDEPGFRVDRFWLCGQAIDIPPTPTAPADFDRDYVRMWTLGMNTSSFATPNRGLSGVVIIMWLGTVWLYDTAHPGWRTLASVAMPTGAGIAAQPFGYDFTFKNGVMRCLGSNRDGNLSEFSVTIDRQAGSYTASVLWNTVSLKQEVPLDISTNFTATWQNAIEEQVTEFDEFLFDGASYYTERFAIVQENVERTMEASYTCTIGGGVSAPERDLFVGGDLNPEPPATSVIATLRVTETPTNSRSEYWYAEESTDGVATYSTDINLAVCDYRYVATHNIKKVGSDAGNVEFSHEYVHDRVADVVVGQPITVVTDNTVITDAGSIPPKQAGRYAYSAMDWHRHKCAFRRGQTRSGFWNHPKVDSPPVHAVGNARAYLDGVSYEFDLLDAGKQSRASVSDLLALFNMPIRNALPYNALFAWSFASTAHTLLSSPSLLKESINTANTTLAFPGAEPVIRGLWFPQYLLHFDPYINGVAGPTNELPANEADAPPSTSYEPSSVWSTQPASDGIRYTRVLAAESADPSLRAFKSNNWDDGPHTLTYDGRRSYTPAQYEAMGSIDVVGPFSPLDPPRYWRTSSPTFPFTTTPYFDSLQVATIMDTFEQKWSDLYAADTNRKADMNVMDDRVYVDPRSDAFYAQHFTEARIDPGNGFDPDPSIIRAITGTFIGNDDSVTTLAAVLTELAGISQQEFEDYAHNFIRPEHDMLTSLI